MIDRSRRTLLLAFVFALASSAMPLAIAAESHDSHGGGHESGKGKGKGGKAGHKDVGSSHSKENHDGGSHTGGSGAGGSKALENKVLRSDRGRGKGPAYMGGATLAATLHITNRKTVTSIDGGHSKPMRPASAPGSAAAGTADAGSRGRSL